LKIVATHVTSAPIHEIASRAGGTFFSVEGEVTLARIGGHQYFVNGKSQKEGSSVWIADAGGEQFRLQALSVARSDEYGVDKYL
jgi:hypothetical protein